MRAKLEAKALARNAGFTKQIVDVAEKHMNLISALSNESDMAHWFQLVEIQLEKAADRGATSWLGGKIPTLYELHLTGNIELSHLHVAIGMHAPEAIGDARAEVCNAYCAVNSAYENYWNEHSDVACTKREDGLFHFDWSLKTKKAKIQ